ncbi:histidine kinase [Roseococcus sp. SYP-B2431]|uniref:HWE histidine kinase domain-containing protein n=1 Tax=Roseococcus sp. SYP-B2431 TaxID=2496640 RepID=UPI00103FAE80|nr:HWE histidine kinase domain-containing protein [Roseococcus sp. SYP-B2431]TCH96697.1 histidine kinase [Roseococcus sp. SYP-B2431]
METVRTSGPTPEIYITEELERRPPRRDDPLREKRALQELAGLMAEQPERVLPRFVDLAMEMTGGVSAGLSLLQETPAPGLFRWRHLRGLLAPFEDSATPGDSSPSAVTLARGAPVLARHPERLYGWIAEGGFELPEILLIPLNLGGETPLGTLWIVAGAEGHFDGGDARAMTELAGFVGIAMRMVRTEGRLQRALADQETLAREISHRLRNLFSVVDGMVRLSARTAGTKEDLAEKISGRMRALAMAHALVRRGSRDAASPTSDLRVLVEQIVRPHEDPAPGAPHRFTWSGPPVRCGEQAVAGLALVLHELAANAAQYGGLATREGRVEISWRFLGGQFVLNWAEQGGPPVAAPPEARGFGATMVEDIVVQRLMGGLDLDWRPQGLVVTITLSPANLAI